MCLNNVIHHSSKETKAPSDLRATNSGSTEVTLQWIKPKVTPKEDLSYTVSSIEKSSIFYESSERISDTSCTFLFFYLLDQFRYLEIHPKTIDVSARLWRIGTEFVGLFPRASC